MIISPDNPTPCTRESDLYYSPVEDGREEIGRTEREALAGVICQTECPLRLACLERALVTNEPYGVWGGMGEGERRRFRAHLDHEGYGPREVPTGAELQSSVLHFYHFMETPMERLQPELLESA